MYDRRRILTIRHRPTASREAEMNSNPRQTTHKCLTTLALPDRFSPRFAEFSRGRDMAVEGLTGDAELFAQTADIRVGLSHRRHHQTNFRRRHPVGPAAVLGDKQWWGLATRYDCEDGSAARGTWRSRTPSWNSHRARP